jgi:hypothetical protein
MADEVPGIRSAVPRSACRLARLCLSAMGYLNISAGAALGIGVPVTAVIGYGAGEKDLDPTSPLLYGVLVPLVAVLVLSGWAYLWGRRGVAEGLVRRIGIVKYLVWINLALVVMEGVGIGIGLVYDPPKKEEQRMVAFACSIEALFLAALIMTIWSISRAERYWKPAKGARP